MFFYFSFFLTYWWRQDGHFPWRWLTDIWDPVCFFSVSALPYFFEGAGFQASNKKEVKWYYELFLVPTPTDTASIKNAAPTSEGKIHKTKSKQMQISYTVLISSKKKRKTNASAALSENCLDHHKLCFSLGKKEDMWGVHDEICWDSINFCCSRSVAELLMNLRYTAKLSCLPVIFFNRLHLRSNMCHSFCRPSPVFVWISYLIHFPWCLYTCFPHERGH